MHYTIDDMNVLAKDIAERAVTEACSFVWQYAYQLELFPDICKEYDYSRDKKKEILRSVIALDEKSFRAVIHILVAGYDPRVKEPSINLSRSSPYIYHTISNFFFREYEKELLFADPSQLELFGEQFPESEIDLLITDIESITNRIMREREFESFFEEIKPSLTEMYNLDDFVDKAKNIIEYYE